MNYLIIGAGQTGRGFIPQFLNVNDKITFLDKDHSLLEKLAKSKSYEITYYDGNPSLQINNYKTLIWDQVNENTIKDFNYILVSIGVSNYDILIDKLLENEIKDLPPVITFENGDNPAKLLDEKLASASITSEFVSQCAIFTTTNNDEINIKSENNKLLYYDKATFKGKVPFNFTQTVDDFELLMRKKLSTYNLLSAYFAYNGYLQGDKYLYEIYENEHFQKELAEFKKQIDSIYYKEYKTTYEEQVVFSQMAVDKFSSKFIKDDIHRNCREVSRKLSNGERIEVPISIFKKYKQDNSILLDLIAKMIIYGKNEEDLSLEVAIDNLTYLGQAEKEIVLKHLL